VKLILFTTDSTHHKYFVQELTNYYPINYIILEQNILSPPFSTYHKFEDERNAYERDIFFNNKTVSFENFAPVFKTNSVNDDICIKFLTNIQPDIVVVFGTRKLALKTIENLSCNIINLHGGDPEMYRGLDSHLWAIYHNDFNMLTTTLHHLNEHLDDGDIILQMPIKIHHGMSIHQLRHYNTDVCIKITVSGLDMYKRYGHFINRTQKTKGRYYSFMPAILKSICLEKFNKYTESL